MPQDEKGDGFWSKADSYQPKTPAMKSWKNKYLESNRSKYGEDEGKPRIENLDDYTNRQLQKENSWNGFIRPQKLFIPLSIISFFNESINGYFCMWGECAPPPPYYHFPRIIALIAVIFWFNMAWQETWRIRKPWKWILLGHVLRSYFWILHVLCLECYGLG